MINWIKRLHPLFDVLALAIVAALITTFVLIDVLHAAAEHNALFTLVKVAGMFCFFMLFLWWGKKTISRSSTKNNS